VARELRARLALALQKEGMLVPAELSMVPPLATR
jgi:hypothetical protein